MDRRRASQGSPTMDEEDRARKRRRQSNEPTSTRAAVRAVFDAVWNHQERNRNIRMHFEQLPSKTAYPDYYTKIGNPVSLNEVKAKLDKYASVDEIKKDLILMVENATLYNKAKSQVHSDALRLRFVIESFPSEDVGGRGKKDADVHPTPGRTSARGSRSGATALQDAQLRIVDELMTLKDDQGELICSYFRTLPSKKSYADYYQVIERPISLNMIRTKVKEGAYKQWSDFEEAFYMIRKNAEQYNDSASDVVKDARSLEEHFTARLYEEKVKLGDQTIAQQKLKLSLGKQHGHASIQSTPTPKIRLNVGSRQSVQQPPAVTAAPQLKQETNGNTPGPRFRSSGSPPRTSQVRQSTLSRPSSHGASASPSIPPAMSMSRSSSAASPPRGLVPNGVGNIPAESVVLLQRSPTPHFQASVAPMPPPAQRLSATPRAPSYSPIPSGMSPAPGPTSAPQIVSNQHYRPPHHYEEPRYRLEGQDPATFFITNMHISSTSYTNGDDQYAKQLRPDPRKFTSQFYLHFPTEFQNLVIIPELSSTLTSRPYRLIFEVKFGSGPGKEIRPSMPNPKNKHEQHFEIRLAQGVVNTVECTVVTQASSKNGTVSIGGWEMERYRLFLMAGA